MKQSKDAILIYGADESGELALSWLAKNSRLGYRPLGFIDDEPQNWGRQIHNVSVLGDEKQILSLITEGVIKGVILTSSAQLDKLKDSPVLTASREHGVWIRVLKIELYDI